jgi:peptidoglycan/LPS O-acetylase OafA/YrhL
MSQHHSSDVPAANSGAPNGQGHLPALDGLRGLAILLVLFHHMRILAGSTVCDQLVSGLMNGGWIGVDLFFVLSGFLITGILYDARQRGRYFLNFYARRTVRIFPLYYAVILLMLVVVPQLSHPVLARLGRVTGDEPWYWLYLSNFLIAFRGTFPSTVLDVSWSLAIEEQFYLLWPAIVLCCERRTLMKICLALMGVALIVRGSLAATGVSPFSIYVLTPARMDALAVGAWVALAVRGPGGIGWLVPRARPVAWITGPMVLAILAWGHMHYESRMVHTIGFTGLALFFGALLVLTVGAPSHGWLGRLFGHPWLTLFGRYSYAIYLFNLPVRILLQDTVFARHWLPRVGNSQLPEQLCFGLAMTGLTLAAALLSWNLYEKHFLKLKKYFPTDREPVPVRARPVLALAGVAMEPPQRGEVEPASHPARHAILSATDHIISTAR